MHVVLVYSERSTPVQYSTVLCLLVCSFQLVPAKKGKALTYTPSTGLLHYKQADILSPLIPRRSSPAQFGAGGKSRPSRGDLRADQHGGSRWCLCSRRTELSGRQLWKHGPDSASAAAFPPAPPLRRGSCVCPRRHGNLLGS